MAQPLTIIIPHRLGKQAATLRLKTGLSKARANFGQFFAIEDETWNGDGVEFRLRALGQTANGKIEAFEDHVRFDVSLPFLLAKFADMIAPIIRKQGQLLLEKSKM